MAGTDRVARGRIGWPASSLRPGLVWFGQGTGLIRSSSFMTGDVFWTWLGGAAVISGIALIVWVFRATRG